MLEALEAGQLVVLPTETVYGVAAREDRPEGLERLDALKGQRTSPYSLAVSGVDRLLPREAWAGRLAPLSGPSARIAARWWPGPVTQVLPALSGPDLGVRVVGLEPVRQLLERCPAPLLMPSANSSGAPAPRSVDELEADLLEQVAVVVDGGRTPLGESSTVVRPAAAGLQLLREGVVSRDDLRQHALGAVLVVCSGNTCRSPMGAALLRDALAKRAADDPRFLPPPVISAGTWAGSGSEASHGSQRAMEGRGLDIAGHRSQGVHPALLAGCDLVLCMTSSHVAAVLELTAELAPEARPVVELFDPRGDEVSDPFGAPDVVYAACADELQTMVGLRVELLCPTPEG